MGDLSLTPEQLVRFNELQTTVDIIVHTYYHSVSNLSDLDHDDLRQVALMAACKVAKQWNPEKAKLTTYGSLLIRGAVLDEFRNSAYTARPNQKQTFEHIEFDEYSREVWATDSDSEQVYLAVDCLHDLNRLRLRPQDKTVFDMSALGYTGREIAKTLGVDESRISQRKREIRKQFTEALDHD